jgi:hypothetical protein
VLLEDLREAQSRGDAAVGGGLYELNPVELTHSLKAPGFTTRKRLVSQPESAWFQPESVWFQPESAWIQPESAWFQPESAWFLKPKAISWFHKVLR